LTRDYKPGWAKMQFKEKFKEWPAWSWDGLPVAPKIGPEVQQYIRSRFIAWANDPANPRRRA
jgi:hypothetical protein